MAGWLDWTRFSNPAPAHGSLKWEPIAPDAVRYGRAHSQAFSDDRKRKRYVIVDAPGATVEALSKLPEARNLLLLNATSRGDTLDDVVRAYAGEDLAGVVLSKVDETASIAPALDAALVPIALLERLGAGVGILEIRTRVAPVRILQLDELAPHRRVHHDQVDNAAELLEHHVRRALCHINRQGTHTRHHITLQRFHV